MGELVGERLDFVGARAASAPKRLVVRLLSRRV